MDFTKGFNEFMARKLEECLTPQEEQTLATAQIDANKLLNNQPVQNESARNNALILIRAYACLLSPEKQAALADQTGFNLDIPARLASYEGMGKGSRQKHHARV